MSLRTTDLMRAQALLSVAVDPASRRTRVTRLHSDPPLLLRPTVATPASSIPGGLSIDGAVFVSIAAGAAGPLGGDHLGLDVDVGPGATLVLRTVAATLLLPGPRGQPSETAVTMRVGAGATLVWLPEPVIAAYRCDHQAVTRISLAAGACLLAREELLLGRHDEPSGSVRQESKVYVDGRILHHQELAIGSCTPGWDGAAVTGGRRALGSVIVSCPDHRPPAVPASSPVTDSPDLAVLALAGPGSLVTAVAPDSRTLRTRLHQGLAHVLGPDRRPERPALQATPPRA